MSEWLARRSVLLTGAAAVVAPRVAAEESAQPRRIGILAAAPFKEFDSFRERLRELGWSEGRNVGFSYRWAEGDDTSYPALAAGLIALKVDVIVTWGLPAALAAKEATGTIPIVMGAIGTALDTGVVPNLAHPGGNITGFSSQISIPPASKSDC